MKKVVYGIIFLVIIVTICVVFSGCDYKIELEQETIQKSLEKKFPIKKDYIIAKYILKNPKVILEEGSDRIGGAITVKVDIGSNKKPLTLKGYIQVSTEINYDKTNYLFYLINSQIDGIQIEGIPIQYIIPINKGLQKLSWEVINKVPIYKINDDNLKKKLARAVLKDVKVKGGKLIVTLGN